MSVRFSWDPAKAASNLARHGVSFDEACSVFDDPGIRLQLQTHADEPRLAAIGYSGANRILFVVVIEVSHGETVRIISARKATRSERKDYEAQQRRR
jgi:uncharacterized DUF497 family protein